MATSSQGKSFVNLFRDSAPYINAFRGRTFVIVFGGEAVLDGQFASLIHDFVLLNSLGIRLVIVFGARPQIEKLQQQRNVDSLLVRGLRLTS